MRGKKSKLLRRISREITELAGLPSETQRMQHKVTGEHINVGLRGMQSYAKRIYKKTRSLDKVVHRLTLESIALLAARRRAAQEAAETSIRENGDATSGSVREPGASDASL